MDTFETIAKAVRPAKQMPPRVKLALDVIMHTMCYKAGTCVVVTSGESFRVYSNHSSTDAFFNTELGGVLESIGVPNYISYDAQKQQCYLFVYENL